MKNLYVPGLVVVLGLAVVLGIGSVNTGEKTVSGLQRGDIIGAFHVTKYAGAEDDGVEQGKNLCYRCRNGARPQVIVFTRSTDQEVIDLLQKLDKAIAKHEDSQLRTFVNLLGDDEEELSAAAKKLAKDSRTKNVPFVVPNEFKNGPDDYEINPKAAVTVILATESSVKVNHTVAEVKDLNADAVIADIDRILL